MRTEIQIVETILSVAKNDEKVRAVILNGSRANKSIPKDDFQDFDIIYLVNELDHFQKHPNWIDVFGERIILQMPNTLQLDVRDIAIKDEITYLMLFKDFNRIDLKLIKVENKDNCKDSLNTILMDKDSLFDEIFTPTDKDYLVKKPPSKVFQDSCNEFWWVTTYIVKGLARNEILYAKDMLEGPVRQMFLNMLAWFVGVETNFSVNVGKSNRFLKKYVSDTMWNRILKTYPNAEKMAIWNSLIEMTNLFHEIAQRVAKKLVLDYNMVEAENINAYLDAMERSVKVN